MKIIVDFHSYVEYCVFVMAKCDTAKQAQKAVLLDADEEMWCRQCMREQFHSEEELPALSCHKCHVYHLKTRMFEKAPGHLCIHCAKIYESNLLKTMMVNT